MIFVVSYFPIFLMTQTLLTLIFSFAS